MQKPLKILNKLFYMGVKKLTTPPSPRLWLPKTSPPLEVYLTHVHTGKIIPPPYAKKAACPCVCHSPHVPPHVVGGHEAEEDGPLRRALRRHGFVRMRRHVRRQDSRETGEIYELTLSVTSAARSARSGFQPIKRSPMYCI